MSFFKRFRKKEDQKDDYLSALAHNNLPEAEKARLRNLSAGERPKDVSSEEADTKDSVSEQKLVDCCERIMEHTNELRKEKKAYDMLTAYLKDTQLIDELPEKERKVLTDTAAEILKVTKTKDSYETKEKRISDERMAEFDTVKDELPNTLRQLKSNEAYQSVVKHDMHHLEGEKSQWGYERTLLRDRQSLLQKMLFGIFAIFLICAIIFAVLTIGYHKDLTLLGSIAGIVAVVLGFLTYLYMQKSARDLKQAEVNLNRSITLLNQMKAKYVNVTRAVEYTYEKYQVRTAYELEYLWDEYMRAVKERETLERANEDLEHYNRKLLLAMQDYHLYDNEIWFHQASALADPKEMVEVRHRLIERRQNVREHMEEEITSIRKERETIEKIVEKQVNLKSEIKEILATVDQMCEKF